MPQGPRLSCAALALSGLPRRARVHVLPAQLGRHRVGAALDVRDQRLFQRASNTPAAPIAVITSTTLPLESNTGALRPLMPGMGSPTARATPRWRTSRSDCSNFSVWLSVGTAPSRRKSSCSRLSIFLGGSSAANTLPVAVLVSDMTVPVRMFTWIG